MSLELILPILSNNEWGGGIVFTLLAIMFVSFSVVFFVTKQSLEDIIAGIIILVFQ